MAFVLTQSDIAVLKEIIGRVRDIRGNPDHRHEERKDPPLAPDVYVVKTPSGGISALTPAAISDSGEDEPGEGDCTIGNLYLDDDDGIIVVEHDAGYERTVYNITGEKIPGSSWALAIRTKTGRWVTPHTQVLRRFELKDAITPSSTNVTAHPLEWTGADWVADTDADREFEVYDPFGVCRGRGKNTYSSPNDLGSQGLCKLWGDSGHWEIVWMQPNALMVRGEIDADFTDDNSTFEISAIGGGTGTQDDGPMVMQPTGGLIVDQDPGDPITVYNILEWNGEEGWGLIAAWNETTAHWEALQMECP